MTAQEILKKYTISLNHNNGEIGLDIRFPKSCPPTADDMAAIKAAKPEIIVILTAEEADKQRRASWMRDNGVDALHEAQSTWSRYNAAMRRYAENDYEGRAPIQPATTIEEIIAKHPAGAAYIKAEAYSMAINFVQSAAGRRAMDAIMDGADPEAALQAMEEEWTKAATQAAQND